MSKDLYREAGVNIERGDSLVSWIKDEMKENTCQSSLGSPIGDIGGFSGLFKVNFSNFKEPILVASTDGVGTKLLLGLQHDCVDHLGQDLVAMCVNDLYTIGAQPLFFLDYFATGKLDETQFKKILESIKGSLELCNTSLLGGETAELPGLYANKHFDLAGFVVGIVDRQKRLQPSLVREGDILIGFESSGFHSNGYSLIRKWLNESKSPIESQLIDRLLEPTRIYHQLPSIIEAHPGSIHALAHITGGGISGNLSRVLPEELGARISKESIQTPEWMLELIHNQNASFDEVEPVLNMGIGMIAAVKSEEADTIINQSKLLDLNCRAIGVVTSETKEIEYT